MGRPTVGKDSPDHPDNVDKPSAGPVEQPELRFPEFADGSPWVPTAPVQRLWESMAVSGFHEYYTQADWEAAITQMMVIDGNIRSMLKNNGELSSMKAAEMRAALGDLMVLESARRRLKIEVQRNEETVAPLAAVAPLDRARAAAL
ncbi:phage terminase small subunit [Amycolatopsis sp. NPDC004368]